MVDIAGIGGKLLISPAPGLLAVPTALIRLDGGWAWKGPGHPVDNGDQTRGQRDGFRSEGAARVLFLRGKAGNQARTGGSGTNLRTGSLFAVNQRLREASKRTVASGEIAVSRRRPVRGYHGLHCP